MKNTTHIVLSLFGRPSSQPALQLRSVLPLAAGMLLLLLATQSTTFAGSATWNTSPSSGDWNTASNWTPSTVPNGSFDTATFDVSNETGVFISANTQVNGIVFNASASAFTISNPAYDLVISGVGITNDSGFTQTFVNEGNPSGGGGFLVFSNSATAGSSTDFTNHASTVDAPGGGLMKFVDHSSAGYGSFTNNGASGSGNHVGFIGFYNRATAGNGTFTNNGGEISVGGFGGGIQFFNRSTANDGIFTINGGAVSGAGGGFIQFFDHSSAGNGIFTVNGGAATGARSGTIIFSSNSTAHAATLIATNGLGGGGQISFAGAANGGKSRVELSGNGLLDISLHLSPGVTIGSIEGNGAVFLGANNLSVGSNNLSTFFFGLIQDGGPNGGIGGSLTKVGTGTLTLTNANTYTGGTTVNGGKLVVTNTSGSGTGSGAVQVNSGRLGGTGKMAGAVTVGTGLSSGAILLAGNSATKPGTLTINNTLSFSSLSTYKCVLNRNTATASKVTALGVTINSNATFILLDSGTGTLPTGTVFKVINNTSASPIGGTFSNLPDGSTFSSGGNIFKADYQGGTGNDLTLTVQ